MRRLAMGVVCVGLSACAPAKVYVVAAPAGGLELTSLELDVDRVVLDGCGGRSKSFDVSDTLDLLDPVGLQLPRGEWCGLSLRTPKQKKKRPPALRMAATLSPDLLFALEAHPSEGRVEGKFTLRKGKQAVLLDVGQWLDQAQLREDLTTTSEWSEEYGVPLLTEPVTSALLASVELSPSLSVLPKKKLDDEVAGLIDAATSRSTDRWSDRSQSNSGGCNGDGCSSDSDTGSDKGDDSGSSEDGDDSGGGGGVDTGVEKSCGDGCGGSGDGCSGSDSGGYTATDTGLVLPGALGLFALARRRRRAEG